jgi:serine/threonine protein kinase
VKLILCKAESELEAIKSEAKILFRMLHDNIVRYFASFIHKDHLGQKYFGVVMEYCEKGDIQSHINHYKSLNSRVSDRRIARWTLEIAEALAYMHAKDLQHRDLKADNVMVRGEQAKVADFGLATVRGRNIVVRLVVCGAALPKRWWAAEGG